MTPARTTARHLPQRTTPAPHLVTAELTLTDRFTTPSNATFLCASAVLGSNIVPCTWRRDGLFGLARPFHPETC